MSVKKLIVVAAIVMPLVGCVAVPEQQGRRDYDRRDYDRPNSPQIDAVQQQQQRKIEAGVRSGEITKAEAKRLEDEQRAIRKEELSYKADGRLTEREREELRREQLEAERNIRREANDAQDVNKR